ncbi:DUF6056 family protein [Persicitalea jodogahamensis]|uniref:Uncharacterized protein n=1 Tax=Persicitalea jodogahamensis TaxID=402147 RepID=A0A8J3D2U9_9BACT|nr:DUF6056 family protein [Persicitalea jodogahamensis]GHB63305.1 hypothetical protein GCM10007390_16420 [Persicitalea jodogahamensis]
MTDLFKKYRKEGNVFNLLLLAFVLLPLLVLSYFNHPSAADDYGYIDTVFKFGWQEAMHYYYTGWTGRYFGIFLNHSNPLLFHSIVGFKVLPVLLLLWLVAAFYGLARHLTPTLSRLAHLGFAGVLYFLFILQIPSLAGFFYWMAAFVTYTIPSILTFGWVIVVLRWYRLETKWMKILTGILAGFLVFAVIGSSEANLLTMLLLIAGYCGFRLLFQRQIDGLMVGVVAAAALGCYLYFTAPGLDVRLGGNPLGGNIPLSFLNAFRMLGIVTLGWITKTPLLLFTAAWLLVLSRITPQARARFAVPFWYVFLLYVGILAAQLFTSYYGIGIDPTEREVNLVYLFFLVGWFYVFGVLYQWASRKLDLPGMSVISQYILIGLLGLQVIFSTYQSASVRAAYGDLLSGRAAAYDAELYRRYELIESSTESVVYLPALKNRPQSLYVDDINQNHNHWWNRLMAGYFGKEAIYMKEETLSDE